MLTNGAELYGQDRPQQPHSQPMSSHRTQGGGRQSPTSICYSTQIAPRTVQSMLAYEQRGLRGTRNMVTLPNQTGLG